MQKMNRGKCQLCLRRLRLNKLGEIVSHYVGGEPCPGTGFAPLEMDDARLAEMIELERQRERSLSRKIAAQFAMRANRIEPELIAQQAKSMRRLQRLEARKKRLDQWPQRFARQMELHGYGDPPPAYIMARGRKGREEG